MSSETDSDDPRTTMPSMVLLERAPRATAPAGFAERLSEELGVRFGDGDATLVASHPVHRIRIDGELYVVEFSARQCVVPPHGILRSTPRAGEAVAAHQAHVRIACATRPADDAGRAALLRRIARIGAVLLDRGSLAVAFSPDHRVFELGPTVLENLRSADPVAALAEASAPPPVVSISDDDPELVDAVARARREWQTFASRFAAAEPGSGAFHVKVPLQQGERVEHVWVTVTAIEEGTVQGRVANEPVDLEGISMGDRVEHDVDAIDDWLFVEGGEQHGGFTLDVVERRYRRDHVEPTTAEGDASPE